MGFVNEQWEKHGCWGFIEIILHILNGDYKPLQGSHMKQPGFNGTYPARFFFVAHMDTHKFVGSTTFLVFHETWWICISDPYAYPPSSPSLRENRPSFFSGRPPFSGEPAVSFGRSKHQHVAKSGRVSAISYPMLATVLHDLLAQPSRLESWFCLLTSNKS